METSYTPSGVLIADPVIPKKATPKTVPELEIDPVSIPQPPVQLNHEKEERDARSAILKKIMMQGLEYEIRKQIREDVTKVTNNPSVQGILLRAEERRQAKKDKETGPYIWLTVNPSKDDLPSLVKKVEKAVAKKWILGYAYAYEQRGESIEDIHGYHAHILIERGEKRPSDARKELWNTFKTLFPGQVAHYTGTFHLRFVEDRENFDSYLRGIKKGDKDKKGEIDALWREINGLEAYYSSS